MTISLVNYKTPNLKPISVIKSIKVPENLRKNIQYLTIHF